MHDLEGEQIDKQRERQRELWKLEDERFNVQRNQQREQTRFQQESIRMQEKFFEERKRLEEEQVKLQRAYATEQMRLQEAALGVQAAAAQEQIKQAEAMRLFGEFATRAAAQGSIFNEDTQLAILAVVSELNPAFKELYDTLKQMVALAKLRGSGGGGSTKDPSEPMQHGGTIRAGELGTINETGIGEMIRPYFTSEIIPMNKFDPWQHGVILPTMDKGSKGSPIILTINVGGKTLKQIVLEAVDKEIDV